MKKRAVDIKDIKEQRLTAIDKKLDTLTALEKKVVSFQQEIVHMNKVIENLENRIDDLENRSRRSNLIVYGLEEEQEETSETLENAVNEKVIKDILELDPVEIERIHRLGKPYREKTRPVIFKLLDGRQKSQILSRGKKLKNTGVSIGEDFSKRVREIRRKLWASTKKRNRENQDKVSLVFDKIYINKRAYVWSDEKNDKLPLGKGDRPPTEKNDRESTRHSTNQRQIKGIVLIKDIVLITVNAHSVLNKIDELENILLDYEPDVAAITETLLSVDAFSDEIAPPNY